MEKTTARVITTLKCTRACPYCVNKQPGILEQGKILLDLKQLEPYREVLLTGGEPVLYPQQLEKLIRSIREMYPQKEIYLYASIWSHRSCVYLLNIVDGIHFTIHNEKDIAKNIEDFQNFQDDIGMNSLLALKRSFRLYILPGIDRPITIRPYLFSRIECKPYKNPCPIPENEDLFLLCNHIWSGAQ